MLALTGPTAVGKSSLAVRVAEAVGAEIVSVDSRQVYRRLDAGTAKPSAADRERVRHHLVDEADLTAPLTAGSFADLANARIAEIQSRGRPVLLVGGSTLYLHALVHGLATIAPEGTGGRVAPSELATPQARQALYDELATVDPEAARTLDPSKTQRLARLVGAWRATGVRPSERWAEAARPVHAIQPVVLTRPRHELYERIEQRVDQMLADGLVEENRALLDAGIRLDQPPLNTIGYQEVVPYVQGEIGQDEMIRLIKRNTRRYAKRQMTWFRRAGYPMLPIAEATVSGLAARVRG